MTDEYKKSLIDYVSGLLTIEEPRQTEFDPEEVAYGGGASDYNSQRWEDVIVALRGKNVCINGILESEFSDIYIMYGGYQEGDSGNSKGFLIYINEYSFPIRTILLDTRGFQVLKYDETSNRVYGITGDRANSPAANDNDAYFVYFDNLFLYSEEGTPTQTYAYKIFTGSGDNYFMARDIVKHPENSWYLIFVTNFRGIINGRVLELKINVGEANQLKTWTMDPDADTTYYCYAFHGWYSGDTPHFKVIGYNRANTQFYVLQDNGNNVSRTAISVDTTPNTPQLSSVKCDYISISQNEIYFVYNASWQGDNATNKQSCLYKFNGTSIQTIYKTQIQEFGPDYYNIPMLNVVRDNNTVYIVQFITDEENNATYVSVANVNEANIPSAWEQIDDASIYVYRFNMYYQRTMLRRKYNIVCFTYFSGYFREGLGTSGSDVNGFAGDRGYMQQQIGYTGYKYSDYNVLVPRFANFYYLSFVLLFSRNFYNVSKFENITTASVEIPANYLNNYQISRPKEFGITNYCLVDKYPFVFTKNKYETIHVNFINTINVIDEDTGTLYPVSAIKVNQSCSNGGQTRYDNCKCIKYRLNYADNTSATETFVWTPINEYNKRTSFVISPEKDITSIDFISNDQSAIYLHIDYNFEAGKKYELKQKVRIGEKPIANDLLYNNQNVLYNNKQVQIQGE